MKKAALPLMMMLIMSFPAFAQTRDPQELTASAYLLCVKDASIRYAGTKELPDDIITAAFGTCYSGQVAYRKAVSDYYTKAVGIAKSEDVDHAVDEAEKVIRRAAMRTIFESRYPVKK